jgi:hypothetical protein
MDFQTIFIRVSQVSTFIPVILGLYYIIRLDTNFKVLLGFVLLSLFIEYFGTWYSHNVSANNLPPLHFYTVVELGFLSFIFCRSMFLNWKLLFAAVLIIGITIALLNATVWGTLYTMNDISRSFESIVLVIFCLIFFRRSLYNIVLNRPLFKQPLFWISSGVFLYFSVNLLFFMLFNEVLKQNKEMAVFGQLLHSITNILTNLLFAQSFRCFKTEES